MSKYISGIELPNGVIFNQYDRRPRLANAKLTLSVNIAGARILDLGCSSGYWSLILSDQASEIVGIDHRAKQIEKGLRTIEALGIKNVNLIYGDVRDPDVFKDLGCFDLVIAYGLMHRVSDPFSLFDLFSRLGKTILVEWRTPVLSGMEELSLAYHSVNRYIDEANVKQITGFKPSEIDKYGEYGFWDMTPGAVKNLAARNDFIYSKILGYHEYWGDDLININLLTRKGLRVRLKELINMETNLPFGKEQFKRIRCSMLLAQSQELLNNFLPQDGKVLTPPNWDWQLRQAWPLKTLS